VFAHKVHNGLHILRPGLPQLIRGLAHPLSVYKYMNYCRFGGPLDLLGGRSSKPNT
jgi:hypothetical protein